ncbi:xylulokinase [Lentilactobacillus sp. SPB1-3]|uniref:FGGY-family carbohydrate kinase n=1 Tax=Lentilactobacillus terminaliae TaxID=3003483 RepID=A0ACD5DES9_9LACO|nr:FGGY family carbohydrate kinase [Lentilactobacillus sp. SPB1-3]MCZ0976413.1 FGGY family carbohydrate kinase [Lentilactobacillus sp. SPB1-3]
MAKYILGIDIGTSGTKAILMTTTGEIVAQKKDNYSFATPHPGWAEANAEDWLNAVTAVIRKLSSHVDDEDIVAIGIDGLYGGSGIPVDKDGNVLGPALIWMDRRATKETDQVKELVSDGELMDTTANLSDPYYGYTKLMWLKENKPDLYNKTDKFLPPESYVILQLTGQTSINYSAAGNLAGIFDINEDKWSQKIADKLGLDTEKLPQKFVTSTESAGSITEAWAQRLGIKAGTPVFNTGVDVGPATVGTGVVKPGEVTVALGTSMNAALVTEKPLRDNGLIIWPYAYRPKNLYYNFAGANTAGAIIAWFVKEFEKELDENDGPKELDFQSMDVPAGSNGLLVLPYFMGERSPLWDSTVRGTILGLSLKTTKYELYNAFQEAISYSVRQSIETFGTEIGDEITLVGGVSNSKKMVQMIADVTGKTVLTTKSGGEANLGSAILAGIGINAVNPEDVSKWIKIDQRVLPNKEKHEIYNQYFKMYKHAYNRVKDFYKDFSAIDND